MGNLLGSLPPLPRSGHIHQQERRIPGAAGGPFAMPLIAVAVIAVAGGAAVDPVIQ